MRSAARSVLGGASVGSVVFDLNHRGVTTATGRPWSYTSLRQVLMRPECRALSPRDEVVGRSTWPSILTEQEWRSVCAILDDPARLTSKSNVVRWLLAGIAICGTCGGPPRRSATVAKTRSQGTTRTVYRCKVSGKGHVARGAQDVDDLVTAVILERMKRPDWREVLAPPDASPDGEALRWRRSPCGSPRGGGRRVRRGQHHGGAVGQDHGQGQ